MTTTPAPAVTDRTAASDAEFRSRIQPFESAPTPPEVVEARVVEEVARALEDSCVNHGLCSWKHLAAAAVAAMRENEEKGARK